MDYTVLGRTGLGVSVIGLGTGGPSRVGQSTGRSAEESVRVIRAALDLGVSFIDTAEAYRTEEIVGKAIAGLPRKEIVLSTKISRWEHLDEAGVKLAVEARLRALGVDYLDICHFHAVPAEQYPLVRDRLAPALLRCREAGTVRFIGITEVFNDDPGHRRAALAVEDDLWDVRMVGFNVLNQSARDRVLAATRRKRIGVLAMFAVRLALSRTERLREVIGELVDRGEITEDELRAAGGSREDPLGWVTRESDADTLVEAAYRFVRHEPGIDVTLSGTGSEAHLEENIASCGKPPLDPGVSERLARLFARVDSVAGQ